jgi:uncharacterized tellurite resistance protein B-like protein
MMRISQKMLIIAVKIKPPLLMTAKERIYDAFGELAYLVAKADGLIQPEEVEALEAILAQHPHGKEIKWSFDYERRQHNDPEDVYQKVLECCRENGPDPEYAFLLEMLEAVAEASAGIDAREDAVITGFARDLTRRFKEDIQSINELR